MGPYGVAEHQKAEVGKEWWRDGWGSERVKRSTSPGRTTTNWYGPYEDSDGPSKKGVKDVSTERVGKS